MLLFRAAEKIVKDVMNETSTMIPAAQLRTVRIRESYNALAEVQGS